MRGTSIGAPDLKHWGFTTRASWFIPSHPHVNSTRKPTLHFSYYRLGHNRTNRAAREAKASTAATCGAACAAAPVNPIASAPDWSH